MHVKYQKVTAGFPTARGMKASPHNRRWCVYSVRLGTLDTPLAAAEIPRQLFEALLGRQRPCLHYPRWHQHEGCRIAKLPSARPEYWLPKLARNQQRDAGTLTALAALGWDSLVIRECDRSDETRVRRALRKFLGAGLD